MYTLLDCGEVYSGPVFAVITMWYVYVLRCSDDSLYTGIATDVARRVAEHNHDDTTGARYTLTRRPVRLVYQESVESRAAAAEREAQIKRLRKRDKESLVTSGRFLDVDIDAIRHP